MKKIVFSLILALTTWIAQARQTDPLSSPVLAVRIDMHGYTLPFGKGLSPKNIGVALGVQLPYNQKGTLTQSVWVGVVNHHLSGKQAYAYTQLGVHPFPNSPVDFGFTIGLGYARAFSGSPTYQQQPDGNWQNASRHKGGLMIPVGVQLGWRGVQKGRTGFSPFVSYQFQPVLGLSEAAPILPNTLLSIGNRFKF
ncbi:hypothetical protein [Runella slithyformis]|uniref:Outer membrane protein beta-barrel domain-containing protein n=1 Tax=Runella slithyformis (strain ATCC 29530 / DSM 19594 / LMG 11500 / NCIMB 11436 / LSU 4) TaxID=761193 RepID=A0A7U3ZRD2_RUNSL|nr:hypothetical protein [Runella slithyformis]AEI51964.1 hypothetical protein Runsl_5675 [Runella slithyformis DSM 19594]